MTEIQSIYSYTLRHTHTPIYTHTCTHLFLHNNGAPLCLAVPVFQQGHSGLKGLGLCCSMFCVQWWEDWLGNAQNPVTRPRFLCVCRNEKPCWEQGGKQHPCQHSLNSRLTSLPSSWQQEKNMFCSLSVGRGDRFGPMLSRAKQFHLLPSLPRPDPLCESGPLFVFTQKANMNFASERRFAPGILTYLTRNNKHCTSFVNQMVFFFPPFHRVSSSQGFFFVYGG